MSHHAIDDYLADMLEDATPPAASAATPAAPVVADAEARTPVPPATDPAAAVAAFASADGEIGEDEFEALLDALHGPAGAAQSIATGTPVASPACAPAPVATAAAPIPATLPATPVESAPPFPLAALSADAGVASSPHYRPVDGEAASDRRRRASDQILAWLRFALGPQVFAVEVLKVQEVLRLPEILPLRGTEPAMRGVMNLRGQIVPVLDLAGRMGLGEQPETEATRVIVLEQGGEAMGLLVQGVADVVNLSVAAIEPLSGPLALHGSEVIRGVARRERDVTILLDAESLLRG